MKNLMNSIIRIGESEHLSSEENSKLRSFNTILFYMGLALFCSLSTNILEQSWLLFDTILYGAGFGVLIIGFVLNHYQKQVISKYLLFICSTIIMAIISIIGGNLYISSIVNLILLGILFSFFENDRAIYCLAFYQLVLVIATVFIIKSINYPFDNTYYNPITRSIVYSICFIVLFVIGRYITVLLGTSRAKNKKLIDDLQERNKEIKQAYEDMEKFAYIISHDMKAPLRSINSFAKLIKRDVTKNKTNNLEEYATFVSDNSKKLGQMIDDVLMYSKLGNNNQISVQDIDTNTLIHQIALNLKNTYTSALINYTDLGTIQGNRTQVLMLFQNLIENGLKYNKNTTPEVTINYKEKTEQHIFDIKDNGIGINSKFHAKVFELFSRLHTDREFEGTGVGLANCKRIVEQHLKGSIQLKSQLGEGTIFTITFPKKIVI